MPFKTSLGYAPTIPGVTFGTYEMMFAVITPLLITGAFAERLKWSSFLIFIIAWELTGLLSISSLGLGQRLAFKIGSF